MKTIKAITIILFLFVYSNAFASDKLTCLRDAYLDYTNQVSKYCSQKDIEFKKSHAKLYKDFSYLITEQQNHNRMQEITIDHLIKIHPKELKLEGSLFNLVPRYKHYAQDIYRELRTNPEFNKLCLDNQSYKKENLMPVFEDLKAASKIVEELDSLPSVVEYRASVIKKSQIMVSNLHCGS